MTANYPVRRHRDATIIDAGEIHIIVAGDSCGGIGNKEADAFRVPTSTVGSYNARVALMEVLSLGAQVVSVFDMVCNEMNPTASEILAGIRTELEKAGLADIVINGSTEENFITKMTAVGVTVIGVAEKGKLKSAPIRPHDRGILIGRPLCGGGVIAHPELLADYQDLKDLVSDPHIREVVPVGSKGILYEAEFLAQGNALHFEPENCGIDLLTSAGPASCIIAVTEDRHIPENPPHILLGEFL
ncbi:hypothetical protein AGMMS49983_13500 [Clostridia bacterium]|nr:hypothetical protein AGMMS49983_13500 [Clostridia bacterium]